MNETEIDLDSKAKVNKHDSRKRKAFPRLTGKQACSQIGQLSKSAFPIVVSASVLDQILEFSDSRPQVEVGGFLLGQFCQDIDIDQSFLEISAFVEATEVQSEYWSLTIKHESWAELHRQLATRFPDHQVVGWHHTHPGFGIFLSQQDEFIHRNFFAQSWQVALVVDPRRGEFGFFQWQDDQMNCNQIVDTGFLVSPADKHHAD